MDAITLIKKDHQTVEAMFRKLEELGPRAHKARKELADRVVHELVVHAAIEETVLYSRVRAELDGLEDQTLEAIEEHHILKVALATLAATGPNDERLPARCKVVIELVRHHVREEEREYLPQVRNAYSKDELTELGEQLATAKQAVSAQPLLAALEAPLEIAASEGAAIVDRLKAVGSVAVKRVRERVAI